MSQQEEVIIETRDDLKNLLKNSNVEYTMLKFYADWWRHVRQFRLLFMNV